MDTESRLEVVKRGQAYLLLCFKYTFCSESSSSRHKEGRRGSRLERRRNGGWGERLGKVIWGGQPPKPPTPYMGEGGGQAVTFVVFPSQAREDNCSDDWREMMQFAR